MKTATLQERRLARLEQPSYGVAEAARILDIPANTLRYWIRATGARRAVITPADPKNEILSFANLIEAYVLSALRREHEVSLQTIRKSVAYLRKQYPSRHPLADYDFATDGKHVFLERLSNIENLSKEGQIELRKVIEAYLRNIKRDSSGIPIKLFPRARFEQTRPTREIVVNLDVAFGRPVLAHSGVRTEIIYQRWQAGESPEELARDYETSEQAIQEALRYEARARNAA
ncbi:MAG: DUF433 domain-containing protein [Chrysiogenetes bacterium]|nr:DUF433 domain-containing protein [Chrysiogenetes bacterium]